MSTYAILLGLLYAPPAVFLVGLCVLYLKTRPKDPSFFNHAREIAALPHFIFTVQAWCVRAAEAYLRLKPAPLRVAELTVTYIQSQALFVLVNFNVAESLASGPKTVQQLVEMSGKASTTNVEWLARVLKFAAEIGLVERTKRPGLEPLPPPGQEQTTAAVKDKSALAAITVDWTLGSGQAIPKDKNFSFGYNANDVYSANAVTACLCRGHPNCMADFVRLFEDHFAVFVNLSEGIEKNESPFEVWSKGVDFWDHLKASPRHGATFDGAMRACNHTGAAMAVKQYNWGQYDLVVDVGGGSGHFVMELLSQHPRLKGMVVDQKEQIQRGQQWWAEHHPDLLPRAKLVVGDMFDAAALPKPPEGFKTCYVLKQILHDWSDADCTAICRAIRNVMPAEAVAAGTVSLVILETGSFEECISPLLMHRLEADMTMLMNFGWGKERDEAQTKALLEASGFSLGRVLPTNGLMAVIEAKPVPVNEGLPAVNGRMKAE